MQCARGFNINMARRRSRDKSTFVPDRPYPCASHTPVLALKPGSAGAISLHVSVGMLIANTTVTPEVVTISLNRHDAPRHE